MMERHLKLNLPKAKLNIPTTTAFYDSTCSYKGRLPSRGSCHPDYSLHYQLVDTSQHNPPFPVLFCSFHS